MPTRAIIQEWYIERFHQAARTTFRDPHSYFHHYTDLSDDGSAQDGARGSGARSTLSTCARTSSPPATRAQLVLDKGPEHRVHSVHLRRV